jgi:hypothetical protein
VESFLIGASMRVPLPGEYLHVVPRLAGCAFKPARTVEIAFAHPAMPVVEH